MSLASVMARLSGPIRVSTEHDGQLLRIVLDRPKGNVLDREMLEAIRARLQEAAREPKTRRLKLVVFEGAGGTFSFGASVPEHLPDRVRPMLQSFHALFRELEALSVPTAAVVRGPCLGGALELAASCGMVFCDITAKLGVPEVTLGVFPPVAAIVLPFRVGGARAAQLITTGVILDGETSARWGLADVCAPDPEAELQGWFERHILPRSALSLRFAWRAARRPLAAAFENELPKLEALYLDELMAHRDPVEGIQAFLEKRAPVWKHE